MKKIFLHRYFLFFVLAVTVEQLMVASSTLWIARLSEAISSGGAWGLWAACFVLSLSLVYLPSTLKTVSLGLSKIRSLELYVTSFVQNLSGLSSLARSQSFRAEREPFLRMEAWATIDEWFDWAGFFLALLFNVVFNVISFVGILGPIFGAAYVAVIPILVILLRSVGETTEACSQQVQQERCRLTQSLGNAWSTILIGNTPHLSFWRSQASETFQKYQSRVKSNILHQEGTTALAMGLSLIPILSVIGWVASQNRNTPATLLILVATLPRHIQIIQNLSDLVLFSLKFRGLLVRLRGLQGALVLPTEAERIRHQGKVNLEETLIQEASAELRPIRQDRESLETMTPARITIRGKNGCGKSTLLYQLKEKLGAEALLIPADGQLVSEETFEVDFSTGQKIRELIRRSAREFSGPVILLDEWDANLDVGNRETLSKEIEQLARNKRVFEVRHRTEAVCN